jgi:TPR repeat protein
LGVLKPLAEGGDAEAQFLLAKEYETGGHITKDPDAAKEWLLKASKQGYTQASWELGIITKDRKEAEKYFIKGTGQDEKPEVVQLMNLKGDLDEVERTLSPISQDWCDHSFTQQRHPEIDDVFRLAEEGNSVAECILGLAYEMGAVNHNHDIQGIPYNSMAEYWFQKSANKGNPAARLHLCLIKNSWAGSTECIERAAKEGDVGAQIFLSEIFIKKDDRARSDADADKWYNYAARQPDINDERFLAESYREGWNGVPKDVVQALCWRNIYVYDMMARSEYLTLPREEEERYKKMIAEYEQGMTPQQIDEANALAKVFNEYWH